MASRCVRNRGLDTAHHHAGLAHSRGIPSASAAVAPATPRRWPRSSCRARGSGVGHAGPCASRVCGDPRIEGRRHRRPLVPCSVDPSMPVAAVGARGGSANSPSRPAACRRAFLGFRLISSTFILGAMLSGWPRLQMRPLKVALILVRARAHMSGRQQSILAII